MLSPPKRNVAFCLSSEKTKNILCKSCRSCLMFLFITGRQKISCTSCKSCLMFFYSGNAKDICKSCLIIIISLHIVEKSTPCTPLSESIAPTHYCQDTIESSFLIRFQRSPSGSTAIHSQSCNSQWHSACRDLDGPLQM